MINLLNANLYRLKRSPDFKIMTTVVIALSFGVIYYWQVIDGGSTTINSTAELFGDFTLLISFISAIIASFYIGDDYDYGTIRNKIIVGHSRTDIYLANLITIFLITLFYYLLYLSVLLIFGYSTFGKLIISKTFIYTCLAIILLCLVYSSIYTLVASLINEKAVSLITNIVITIIMLIVSIYALNILTTSETIDSVYVVDGEMIETAIPNPNYPSKLKRNICSLIGYILPLGQSLKFFGKITTNFKYQFLSWAILTIIITYIGLTFFKRKDLK